MESKKKGRGRPPIGDKRMTDAEKQKLYRDRRKNASIKEAHFIITGSLVDDLDLIAQFFELSRTQVVSDLITPIVKELVPMMTDAAARIEKTLEQFPEPPSPETLTKLKMEYWQTLKLNMEA